MALNLGLIARTGNNAANAAAASVGKVVKGATPHTAHPANDSFPSSLLVPMESFGQMSQQAHNAANSDVNAAIAGLPTDEMAQQQYGTLGTNLSGISQALVDALGNTQHYQIGTANGVAQGYTNAASADQSAAQQAALALGGTAAPLSGSSGAAAAALSSPGVSAANATGGLIDAAKLRGADLQISNQQGLSSALANLAAQRTAETAKGASDYNSYLTAAQKANQQAAIANQSGAFKYADLKVRQQNADTAAAYDTVLAKLRAAANGVTANYDTSKANQGQQNANTNQYRATHPTSGGSGTTKNPATGYTPAETTRAVGSLETSETKAAAAGLKGTKTTGKTADRYTLTYSAPPPSLVGPNVVKTKTLTPEQYKEYMAAPPSQRAIIAGIPHGTYVDGSFQTPQPSHYSTTSSVGGRSYYSTEHTLEAQIAKAAALYHLGWNDAKVTQEAEQAMVRGGWKPGMYGMPGGAPAPGAASYVPPTSGPNRAA